MNNIKLEFEKSSNNTQGKDKFSFFIKQANEMFKNYEKQIEYYKKKLKMFNPNDLKMELTNWEEVEEEIRLKTKRINPKNFFSIIPNDEQVFEQTVEKIKIYAKLIPDYDRQISVEESVDAIKKLYEKKLLSLYHENKSLKEMVDKLTYDVVNKLQEKINILGDLCNKQCNEKLELENKLKSVDAIFDQNSQLKAIINDKDNEITEFNKQQIASMSKIEQLSNKIKQLNNDINLKNQIINEKEKIINTYELNISQLNNSINEKDIIINNNKNTLNEKEKEIKLLYDDNVNWEEKYKNQSKEIENFKKWSLWDQNIIESFKKIEKLEEEIKEKNESLNKFTEENSQIKNLNTELKNNLENTEKNLEKSKKENDDLMEIKIKYEKNSFKIDGYDKFKDENENYKKEIETLNEKYNKDTESLNNKYNKEIEQLKDKYESQIIKDKKDYTLEIEKFTKEREDITDKIKKEIENNNKEIIIKLKNEIQLKDDNIKEQKSQIDKLVNDNIQYQKDFSKKSEMVKNLNILYDNLLNKLKDKEEKLSKYESSKDKSGLNLNSIEEENNKIQTTIDKYAFTKEILTDYLFCLYLYESGISIQNITTHIINNLSSYLNFAFKDLSNKENSYNNHSNFPNSAMQYEFIEDILFSAFDKIISKKIFLSGEIPLVNGKLDPSIGRISFEDFDDSTICEICYELISKNIITRLKNPKSLKQLTTLFINKYNKKFDLDIKLDDFMSKNIIPNVSKRIQRYDNEIFQDMRNLVELLLHNIKNGRLYLNNMEAYSFEYYYDVYNKYSNLTDRNITIEITGEILRAEAIDNVSHTFKFYSPNNIIFNQCFNSPKLPIELPKNIKNSEIEKISSNYANSKINFAFANFNIINSINKILSNVSLYQQNIKQLTFNSNRLNTHLFSSKIMNVIKSLKNLNYLNLTNDNLKDDDIKIITDYIKDNKTIKTLILNNNNISSGSGFYFADCLSRNKILEDLYLSNNNIRENGLNTLINILINNNTTLKKLDISYNNLTREDFNIIGQYISNNLNLKYLDLSGNLINAQTANSFGISLRKNKNLTCLKLNKCGLNEESAPQLLNYMNETNISNIELDENKFGEMGPLIILNKLRATLSLKELSLQSCEIIPNFLNTVAQNLKDWNNLEKINLKNNSFTDEDLKLFCEEIKNNKKILVKFSKNKLSSNAIEIVRNYKNLKLE